MYYFFLYRSLYASTYFFFVHLKSLKVAHEMYYYGNCRIDRWVVCDLSYVKAYIQNNPINLLMEKFRIVFSWKNDNKFYVCNLIEWVQLHIELIDLKWNLSDIYVLRWINFYYAFWLDLFLLLYRCLSFIPI